MMQREQGERYYGRGPYFKDGTGFYISLERRERGALVFRAYVRYDELPREFRRFASPGWTASFKNLATAREVAHALNEMTVPLRRARLR